MGVPRAAIYLRVSTTEQAQEGFGLDAQRTQCEAMATVKGWEVVEVFSDEGISGTKDEADRPALAALCEAVGAHAVDAVIVAALDRLGRSTRLVLRLVDRMDAGGVDLVSCKESLDTSTASGRFVLRMFASLAELERDNIVERTTAGRDARGRKDGERGGRVPMGYQRVGSGDQLEIEIDHQWAAIVRRIFRDHEAGLSMLAIADRLNADGIETVRGGQWHASSVKVVLGNEDKYRGGRRWESEVRWPEILG